MPDLYPERDPEEARRERDARMLAETDREWMADLLVGTVMEDIPAGNSMHFRNGGWYRSRSVPKKGTIQREWMELGVHVYRMVRPLVRWLNRQSWVRSYAEWAEKYVPRWLTPLNVAYLGFALYAALVVYALVTGKA